MTDGDYGALRAAAALWAGASVLITDSRGRVLVQRVDYREEHLLPGGGIDRFESPAAAAGRELSEELGITMSLQRGLAVDWVPSTSRVPPAMRFPGELILVYDGGIWDAARIGEVRLPESEITGITFAEPAQLPLLMSPADARRTLAALRARVNGAGTVLLEDGLPLAPTLLDRVNAFTRPRTAHHWPWQTGRPPAGIPVRQSWGWLFAPDGRVLVLLDPANGAACLPGGTPEPCDQGNPAATLVREAFEEAAAQITAPVLLGHLPDENTGHGPCARVRMAAVLTRVGRSRPDPATGQSYVRALATPEQVADLFDWGDAAHDQLTAVHGERARLGLPRPPRRPITEIPHDGILPTDATRTLPSREYGTRSGGSA
ncbi:NUDIX hydrolase [Streptomyces sp. NPDC001787]|uniref:NUDIX hydrolase n=1 Tax=Streptomyces sp. NPDC001787 TaxID=3154523 RepID=UPI00331D91B6